MAFLPQFEKDIFVSYAHVDDEPLPGADKGWVTNLVNCIQIRLAQMLGRSDAYSLWMDHELSGHEPLAQQITDALRKTAILIAILSPGYAASKWCQREKNEFLKLVRERRSSSVFVVEREPVEQSERPEEFKELLGYRFWLRDRDGKPPHILGSPSPDRADREYYARVDDLCTQLVAELKQRRAESEDAAHLARPFEIEPSKSGQTVFLAQVTDDLEAQRNNVKRFLDQLKVNVVPATWYSLEPREFHKSVERDLAKSSFFIQLLSEVAGKKPPDMPKGYAQLQLDLALAVGKPILQWRRPGLDLSAVEDAAQKALLEGGHVRAEGIEEFKREIQVRIFEHPAKTSRRQPNTFLFVNMDSKDRPLAEEICRILENHGAGYSLPARSDDPGANRKDMEENLLTCTAAIVVYGGTTANWVRSQLLEFRKIIANRMTPLKTLAVFEGPPAEKSNLDLKLPNMQVWNFRKGISETELVHFLDQVTQEAA